MKKMKKITVFSHKAENPIVLESGDAYDSEATLSIGEKILLKFLMNVDSGVIKKTKGKIEIANGIYKVKCERHSRLGKCLRVFALDGGGVIPTIQPNILHNNQKVAYGILIHAGGRKADNSAGCLTIHPDTYKLFIDLWKIGEEGILEKL